MSPTLEAETGPRWDRTVPVWAELGSEILCYSLCVFKKSEMGGAMLWGEPMRREESEVKKGNSSLLPICPPAAGDGWANQTMALRSEAANVLCYQLRLC